MRRSGTRGAAERGDRGASAIELSIVAPVILLLIFFTVQVALWLYGRNVALQAAREGVSTLRLVGETEDIPAAESRTETNTEAYATKVGAQSLLDPLATAHFNGATGRVRVTVTGHVVSLVGLNLTVTRSATGEVERFEGDDR
jgi:Flp pilus assembly protein TadG